jgi:hypothetical protein
MGYVEFTDATGRSWRVWHTVPELAQHRITLPQEWNDGWLTFESSGDKRRLAPVPAEWESLPPQRLELLCRMAQPSTQSPQAEAVLRHEERTRE